MTAAVKAVKGAAVAGVIIVVRVVRAEAVRVMAAVRVSTAR